MMENKMFYGDNLQILRNREYFPDGCVDLIYLDPPFNSNRNYNVLFKSQSGEDSEAQITAFHDTWNWGPTAEQAYEELTRESSWAEVVIAMEALMTLIGRSPMLAYLVMMTGRLMELHRVLKATGTLYLHCDPTASHYLKVILDTIFGADNFRNEIIWHYDGPQRPSRRNFGKKHDVILRYSKTKRFFANEDGIFPETLLTDDELEDYKQDEDGRYFYDLPRGDYTDNSIARLESEGRIRRTRTGKVRVKYYLRSDDSGVYRRKQIHDVWNDIPSIGHAGGNERLNFETQKPVALCKRIIDASTKAGDIVLDPFCGCGSATAAAHELHRHWIGIDITHLSIALQKHRLHNNYGLVSGRDYKVIGEPQTVDGARELANDSANEGRYQFEWWALSLVGAKPAKKGKAGSRRGAKGGDRGVDGIIFFREMDEKGYKAGKFAQVLVQVKSGKVKPADIRDLKGTVEREKAAMGVLITLEHPTQEMTIEALAAGSYASKHWRRSYRRIQILTIDDLLGDATVDMPPQPGSQMSPGETMGREAQKDLV